MGLHLLRCVVASLLVVMLASACSGSDASVVGDGGASADTSTGADGAGSDASAEASDGGAGDGSALDARADTSAGDAGCTATGCTLPLMCCPSTGRCYNRSCLSCCM
jgi:hypothetical protein